jgi:hypothetical protein
LAEVQVQWGTTAVAMQVVVPPSKPAVMSDDRLAQFVGTYDMSFMALPGWQTNAQLEVFSEGGMLRGRLPFTWHPDDEIEFDLISAGGSRFNPGLYRGDVLFNIEIGINLEFEVGEDHATAVRVRGTAGEPLGDGVPVP